MGKHHLWKRSVAFTLALFLLFTSTGFTALAQQSQVQYSVQAVEGKNNEGDASAESIETPELEQGLGQAAPSMTDGGEQHEEELDSDNLPVQPPEGDKPNGEASASENPPTEESVMVTPSVTESPSLFVSWDAGDVSGQVHLTLELQNAAADTAVEVRIHLDDEEYEALTTTLEDTLMKDSATSTLYCVLDGETPLLYQVLEFQPLAPDFTVEVSQQDIQVVFSGENAQQAQWEFSGQSITFAEDCDWDVEVLAGEDVEWLDSSATPLRFYVEIKPDPSAGEMAELLSQTAEIILNLPDPLCFVGGEIAFQEESNQITVAGVPAIDISGLPEGVQVSNLDRQDHQISFVILREFSGQQEAVPMELSLTVYPDVLTKPETAALQPARLLLAPEVQEPAPMDEIPVTLEVVVGSVPIWGEAFTAFQTAQDSLMLRTREQIQVTRWRDAYEHQVFWVDNNNEKNIRPSLTIHPQPQLAYRIALEGQEFTGEYTALTMENCQEIGLDHIPQGSYMQMGTGEWLYSMAGNQLPESFTKTNIYGDSSNYIVDWAFLPQQAEGYALVDVNETNKDYYTSIDTLGWYYALEEELQFYIVVRRGDTPLPGDITQSIIDNFRLEIQWSGVDGEQNIPLNTIVDHISGATITATSGVLTVDKIWKYNLDGSLMDYKLARYSATGDQASDILPLEGMDGDYLNILYDNTVVPQHGSVTDALHSGGTMYLTLTGTKPYSATKVWLDDGTVDTVAQRPSGEFQLWRYRKGQSYTTAAPLRNGDGTIVTLELDTTQNTQEVTFQVDFNGDGTLTDNLLPKYDTEGYEYIYVAREYLYGSSYEQVFGRVEDGQVIDSVVNDEGVLVETTQERASGHTFLYSGGTLSNRIHSNMQTTVTKVWDASAFQSEFKDVTIALKLQSRQAGSQEDWKDTDYETIIMDNFYPENLSVTESRTVSLYDIYGHKQEYRWIESAVYQGENTDNLLEETENGGFFVLKQSGRDIRYQSTSQVMEDGSTRITNSIDNTIDYFVTKVWLDAQGNETEAPQGATVTFGIYQTISGEKPGETPVAQFQLDGVADDAPVIVNEALQIQVQETEPWVAQVTPLEEYDQAGRQYEYILMELGLTNGYFPTVETSQDEDQNYHSTVYNGPGEGHRVMVRKDWVDDSDIQHRLPVTIQAFDRQTNQPVGTPLVLGDGIWYGYIGIGQLRPEDVYILETKVGDRQIPLTTYFLEGQEPPNYSDPQPPNEYTGDSGDGYTAIQYTTRYHRYEVVYSREMIADTLFYCVSNRRLGNVNLTVTKNWVDGNGETRQKIQDILDTLAEDVPRLVLRLQFSGSVEGYYTITREEHSTVTVGNRDDKVPILNDTGDRVSSIQDIDLNQDTSTYYFHNLPKYDRNGLVVKYTIAEVWLDSQGNILSTSQLAEAYPELYALWKEYATSIQLVSYTVEEESLHSVDTQVMEVNNRKIGSKSIVWYKQWNDYYNYVNHLRPDIYLDIYQRVHLSHSETKVSLYQANYRWTYSEDDSGGLYDPIYHWQASFTGLPKYDSLGYEIEYFAVEHTLVNEGDFDYKETVYSYPMDGGTNPVPIGTVFDIAETYAAYAADISQLEQESTPHYALLEGGTFTNYLEAAAVIRGQKIWKNLPVGYLNENLPEITFTLFQSLENGPETPISTLTITHDLWKKLYANGSYGFLILYEGENTLGFDGEGNLICTGIPQANRLPKYDASGKLYTYTLKETDIRWPDQLDTANWDQVYLEPTVNTFQVTNTYKSEKGNLTVKKYLELPLNDQNEPEAYPAIRFKLTRSYRTVGGQQEDIYFVRYGTWSSSQVRDAYQQAADPTQPLEGTVAFTDLDLYAPNGSPYSYTVTEVKESYLEGYDTWAAPGDVPIADLESDSRITNVVAGLEPVAGDSEPAPVSATFLNRPQKTNRDTVTLEGKKVWDDFQNLFSTRPETLQVTLWRYANQQSGQGNGIPKTELPAGEYQIQWTENGDVWSYVITGSGGQGLEQYAPNGMPWEYEVVETIPQNYTSPSNGVARENTQTGQTITMRDLTNSTATSIPFSKSWVDENGNIIDQDYLGTELSVTFQLEVAQQGQGSLQWQDGESFFRAKLSSDSYEKLFGSYQFTQTLTGTIQNEDVWGKDHTFTHLPRWIAPDEPNLVYRVVETQVSYGSTTLLYEAVDQDEGRGYTYTVSPQGLFSPYYRDEQGNVSDRYLVTQTDFYNQMDTQSLTVTKTWVNDSQNRYSTRPATQRPGYDWEISFLIQRTTDQLSWQTVTIHYEDGVVAPCIVYVYGGNLQASSSVTVEGLPSTDLSGNPYTYRAVELEPGDTADYWHGDRTVDEAESGIVAQGGSYHTAYKVSYDSSLLSASNQMETIQLSATKEWHGPAASTLTMELQYLHADGTWKTFATRARVELNGERDENPPAPYYETEPLDGKWNAVWTGVPKMLPNSDLSQNGQTQYRIVEVVPSGYLALSSTQQRVSPGTPAHFINVQKTSLQVEKIWGTAQAKPSGVTVDLYRTTQLDQVGQVAEANQVDNKTLTLRASTWKGSFTNLPKYSPQGELYYYYAVEKTVGENPVSQSGYTIYHYNTPVANAGNTVTKIVNVGHKSITVTKNWKDYSNGYQTRPNDLALILYRQISGGSPTVVTDVSPTNWVINGNTWTCSYVDLPESDQNGNLYTYWVEETVPTTATGEDSYVLTQNGTQLTNTLTGTIDIPVTKVWVDGGDSDGLRPDAITIILYANGQEKQRHTLQAPGILGSLLGSNTWSYTFTGLPKYDADGKKIVYTIGEEAVNGYATAIDPGSFTITNTLLTQFPVEKIWGGIADGQRQEVTVGLYRTTNANTTPAAVTDQAGTPLTLKLNEANQWTNVFTSLPRFAPTGERYLYSVQELTVGSTPAGETGYLIHVNDRPDGGAVISNIRAVALSGTKTWKDNHNQYGTRPSSLTLILQRTTDSVITDATHWDTVTSIAPVWTGTDTDDWRYTYSNLPATNDQGVLYTYRVQEVVPETATGTDHYRLEQTGNDLVNILEGTINIPVTKLWIDQDDAFAMRPETVTVKLLANGADTGKTLQLTAPTGLGTLFSDQNRWTGQFTDLPEYDTDGKRIVYTVEETPVPDGYEVSYGSAVDGGKIGDGLVVTNTGFGRLAIHKTVTGSRGNRSKEFTFTVQFTDALSGEPLAGSFPCTITHQDGTTERVEIQNGGILLLKHDETAVVDRLPNGTSYQVTESDNKGYRVIQSGTTGTISAGLVMTAEFTNHRSGYSDPDDPPAPKDPPTTDNGQPPVEELPHTGQNWLLPILLALAGAGALGWGLISRRKNHEL